MKKLISTSLIALQIVTLNFSRTVLAQNNEQQILGACSSFLTSDDRKNVFFSEKDNVCIIGTNSAEEAGIDLSLNEDNYLVDNSSDFLNILKNSDKDVAFVVEDDLAMLMSEQNEVLPFIAAVVAADAALIATMWAVSVGYAK